jgi:23S rRNA (uridine2552-2'-O)-methyltransferase
MAKKDHYYNKSKQEGYRARSAYKLIQIHEEVEIFSAGDCVVDLGAAPGGWLQVAREYECWPVIGVDRNSIDPIEGVETIRGDIESDEVLAEIRETIGSFESDEIKGEYPVDVVLSDLAPNMTGEYSLDHARSVHLARQALAVAESVVGKGGNFVVKVFDGPDLPEFRESVADSFAYCRVVRPDASRDASSEVYVVGKNRILAPVVEGDIETVTISDVGDEGDGITKIEGYTIFVPGVQQGETVNIEIIDRKPRYGFAERIDE